MYRALHKLEEIAIDTASLYRTGYLTLYPPQTWASLKSLPDQRRKRHFLRPLFSRLAKQGKLSIIRLQSKHQKVHSAQPVEITDGCLEYFKVILKISSCSSTLVTVDKTEIAMKFGAEDQYLTSSCSPCFKKAAAFKVNSAQLDLPTLNLVLATARAFLSAFNYTLYSFRLSS